MMRVHFTARHADGSKRQHQTGSLEVSLRVHAEFLAPHNFPQTTNPELRWVLLRFTELGALYI